MTIALVGTPQVAFASGSGTSLSTPAVAHTAGNLLVVTVAWEATAANASVSNSAGDAFWTAGPRVNHAGGAMFAQIFYCEQSAGKASDVVTLTLSTAATFRSIMVSEWSHTQRVQLDVAGVGSAQVTGGTTITVTPAPTTAESTVVCVGVQTFAPSAVTNTVGGYTDGPDPANELTQWYKVVTAAGGITSTFTFGADNVQALFAVFRENSSPGVGGPQPGSRLPHPSMGDPMVGTRELLDARMW